MGKNKLKKFGELEELPHVFQLRYDEVNSGAECPMKGQWSRFFGNDNPVVVELGCGRGEYTVELAKRYPDRNYIGVDVKGARLWAGAKESWLAGMKNVAFIRTNIEMITHCFAAGEVSEIWLTFPDPQMKKRSKRLTSVDMMQKYETLLREDGTIHLKTDSNFMFTYTMAMADENLLPVKACNNDIYNNLPVDNVLSIKTYYEQQWLARGLTIKYLAFGIVHRGEWKEPDVEIELDPYRSYGRSKRSELNLNR
jgi:tRNA (guanine-N7-)-methyltransferase